MEVHCFGGEGRYVAGAERDLERQLAGRLFRCIGWRGRATRAAWPKTATRPSSRSQAAWRCRRPGTARARPDRPFILWASLWRHPLTLAHLGSLPFMRRIYRQARRGAHLWPACVEVRRALPQRRNAELVAPQAVEAEVFGRAVSGLRGRRVARRDRAPSDGPLVLFVGRLVPEKGVEALLRAWRQLERPGATLVLAGEGPLRGAEDARASASSDTCPASAWRSPYLAVRRGGGAVAGDAPLPRALGPRLSTRRCTPARQ